MFKMLGIVMIVCSCTAMGFLASSRLSLRIKSLGELIMALEIAESEIFFKLSPIPQIMKSAANATGGGVREMFLELYQKTNIVSSSTFSEKWLSVLKKSQDRLGLSPGDIEVLSELSTFLGRYDAERQTNSLAYIRRRLETALADAEEEQKSKGKIYRALGAASGLIIAISFF